MHIECYNLKAKRIICKVDNQTVMFKDDQDGNAYADIELEEGKHLNKTLTVFHTCLLFEYIKSGFLCLGDKILNRGTSGIC